MYLPIQPQPSCAQAWVAAATKLIQSGDEAYNVVIDVEDATTHSSADNAVITLVDRFLRKHDQYPIISVANTIFPQALYEAHGAPGLYAEYFRVYDALSVTKGWGRYFARMTRHRTLDGSTYNPLDELIDKLRRQQKRQQRYKSAYELAIYDPLNDRKMFRGSQCLSFVSMKLHPSKGLCLTALYRNHMYIGRCLGNLIGLGRLQAFIASEAGVPRGSLTCISTHAELDALGSGIKSARSLVKSAAALLDSNEVAMAAPRRTAPHSRPARQSRREGASE